jgi:hypothetical protein
LAVSTPPPGRGSADACGPDGTRILAGGVGKPADLHHADVRHAFSTAQVNRYGRTDTVHIDERTCLWPRPGSARTTEDGVETDERPVAESPGSSSVPGGKQLASRSRHARRCAGVWPRRG